MTTPPEPVPPNRDPRPEADGRAVGLSAVILVVLSAVVIFWAGLSLGSQTGGRSAEERAAIEAFTETYRIINDEYIGTPAPEELLEGAIQGMFDVLDDPHSGYMRADEFESALDEARGEFEGIGAVMATEDEAGERCEHIGAGCQLRVTRTLPGAPAEAAGLLAGDVVTGVDGTALDGATIDDSVRRIRGPRGSDVTLTLEREGDPLDLVIRRDTVVSRDVHSAILADGRVGYLGVDSFSSAAADDFEAALQAHLEAGLDKLVIDLRDDPGGFVDATVEIGDHFLADGALYWEEDAGGEPIPVDAAEGGLALDPELDIAVLVDGGTASAAEILAGALQDAGRAELVGERTFGKGTVQEWTELPAESGGFRLSVAKWLTRDQHWVEGVGLIPDLPVAAAGERYWAGAAGADPEADEQLVAAVGLVLGEPPAGPPAEPGASPTLESPLAGS
jgi:carboxyl-terminal processing protease